MLVGMLERFGGYTLASLRAEDARLVGMVELVDIARSVT